MRRAVLAVLVVTALLTGCSALPVPRRSHHRAAPTTIAVFLRHDVTAAQHQEIGSKLRTAAGVQSVEYISRTEAYRRAKKVLADNPDLVIRYEDVFASYHARFGDRDDADEALGAVRHLPGVERAWVLPSPSPSTTP